MMETNKVLCEKLLGDGKVWEYKKKYKEKYGENAPPFCIWGAETVEEYKERLRKAVED